MFKNYGGRGITVCERWLDSFESFYADMGPRPSAQYSLDRFPNNDGHYEPGNCRWAIPKEQATNRRPSPTTVVFSTGETINRASVRIGVPVKTIQARRERGWPEHRTINTPLLSRAVVRHDGRTFGEWARLTGISRHVLNVRVTRLGWTLERALTTPVRLKKHH